MDKRYRYCRKCKQQWNPLLHDSDSICPHCGHKMTVGEDFETDFFGQLGFKGCGFMILIAIIILFVYRIMR